MKTQPRVLAALTATFASAGCFLLLILAVVSYGFAETVRAFWWLIAGTSLFAGVVRLFFKRESLILSLACGALLAACSFFITLALVISGI